MILGQVNVASHEQNWILVLVNDEICREVMKFEPPVHVMWELFLDKGGKRISKSFGNVFTPQVWMNYGSPQSLMLLMLKRFEGTRELDVTDIPKYMDEMNKLDQNYFELKKIKEERDKVNTKRLFEFVNLLKPPKKPSLHVAYDTWIELLKILPENEKDQLDFVMKKLKDFGHMEPKTLEEETEKFIEERLQYAKNWHKDFILQKTEGGKFEIPGDAKPAIQELIQLIERENKRRFATGKNDLIKPVSRDCDFEATLQAQGFSSESIIKFGGNVLVKSFDYPFLKNVEVRTVYNENVTNLISKDIRNKAESAAMALNSKFAGVDIITLDPTLSIEEGGGVVNEINTNPGLHHHYNLLNNEGLSPAIEVLRYLLRIDPM